eukprot:COSAG02_NODE_1867_length_10594_cov_221.941591_9_plen_62_part_00
MSAQGHRLPFSPSIRFPLRVVFVLAHSVVFVVFVVVVFVVVFVVVVFVVVICPFRDRRDPT